MPRVGSPRGTGRGANTSTPKPQSNPKPAPEQPAGDLGDYGFSFGEPPLNVQGIPGGGGYVPLPAAVSSPQAPSPESGGMLRKLFNAGLIGLGSVLGYNAIFGESEDDAARRQYREQTLMDLLMGVPEQSGNQAMLMQDLSRAENMLRSRERSPNMRFRTPRPSSDLRGLLSQSDLARIKQYRMGAGRSLAESLAAEGLY